MPTGAALCGIISIASIKDQVEEDEVKVRCNNKGIKDNVEVLCQQQVRGAAKNGKCGA
jgi:hypothetical protein